MQTGTPVLQTVRRHTSLFHVSQWTRTESKSARNYLNATNITRQQQIPHKWSYPDQNLFSVYCLQSWSETKGRCVKMKESLWGFYCVPDTVAGVRAGGNRGMKAKTRERWKKNNVQQMKIKWYIRWEKTFAARNIINMYKCPIKDVALGEIM